MLWLISKLCLVETLSKHPAVSIQFGDIICKRLNHTVTPRMMELSLFKGFSDKFKKVLITLCDRQVYFPNTDLAHEGEPCQDMFVINVGCAVMKKKGFTIKALRDSSIFGCPNMLGILQRCSVTLSCTQTAHVLRITRAHWNQAQEYFPQLVPTQQLLAAQKKHAKNLDKALTAEYIKKRMCLYSVGNQVSGDQNARLNETFEAWREYTFRRRKANKIRAQMEERRSTSVNKWMQRKKDCLGKEQKNGDPENMMGTCSTVWMGRQFSMMDSRSTVCMASTQINAPIPQPKVAGKQVAPTHDCPQLDVVAKNWPKPRPSKYYNLRFLSVIKELAQTTFLNDSISILPVLKPSDQ